MAACDGALLMPEQPVAETNAAMADAVSRMNLRPREREFILSALQA